MLEGLSGGARRTGLGEKKIAYLQIPTLKPLIFLEQDAVAAIVYERSESNFSVTNYSKRDESIEINELGISLELKSIYSRAFSESSNRMKRSKTSLKL